MRILILLISFVALYSCYSNNENAAIISQETIPKEIEKEEIKIDSISVDTSMVYKIVEEMPLFQLCDEETKDERELKKCSDEKLITYVNKNLKYPENATMDMFESTHGVARFTVNTDGTISDIEILKKLITEEHFKKLIEEMPKWGRVGKHKGQKVKVSFTFAIRIHLSM